MKLFNSNLPKPNALAIIMAVASSISLTAQAAPSAKNGNPGVPGLVNELETQINDQNATIEDLQATIEALRNAISSSPVPRTGQTDSYAAGDDGDIQAGIAPPDPRFTDNLDGTVTDNLTGLIWLQDATCDSFGQHGNGYVDLWQNALDAANSLMDGECNLSDGSAAGDWRMPNINELQSLVDHSNVGPALTPGHAFVDVQIVPYWTSSTIPTASDWVFGVNVGNGFSGAIYKFNDSGFVWPVRGGQ